MVDVHTTPLQRRAADLEVPELDVDAVRVSPSTTQPTSQAASAGMGMDFSDFDSEDDVLAKARQRIREKREREKAERVKEVEAEEQRKAEIQAQHELRLQRQAEDRKRMLLAKKREEELRAARLAEEEEKLHARHQHREERAVDLQRQVQARLRAESEKRKRLKAEQERKVEQERLQKQEADAKKAKDLQEAARKRVALARQAKAQKPEMCSHSEASEQESEQEVLGQKAANRGVDLQKKAMQRLRKRQQEERRKQEDNLIKIEKEQHEREQRAVEESQELEARREQAAKRAAERRRKEKEDEEKRRLEREETDRKARERKQRYAKPELIAELKQSGEAAVMPLAEEQRRQAFLKKKAEVEKLKKYGEQKKAEEGAASDHGSGATRAPRRGRPPLAPGRAAAAAQARLEADQPEAPLSLSVIASKPPLPPTQNDARNSTRRASERGVPAAANITASPSAPMPASPRSADEDEALDEIDLRHVANPYEDLPSPSGEEGPHEYGEFESADEAGAAYDVAEDRQERFIDASLNTEIQAGGESQLLKEAHGEEQEPSDEDVPPLESASVLVVGHSSEVPPALVTADHMQAHPATEDNGAQDSAEDLAVQACEGAVVAAADGEMRASQEEILQAAEESRELAGDCADPQPDEASMEPDDEEPAAGEHEEVADAIGGPAQLSPEALEHSVHDGSSPLDVEAQEDEEPTDAHVGPEEDEGAQAMLDDFDVDNACPAPEGRLDQEAPQASCELDDALLAEPAVLQPAEVAELPEQGSNEADEFAVACAGGDRAEEEEEEGETPLEADGTSEAALDGQTGNDDHDAASQAQPEEASMEPDAREASLRDEVPAAGEHEADEAGASSQTSAEALEHSVHDVNSPLDVEATEEAAVDAQEEGRAEEQDPSMLDDFNAHGVTSCPAGQPDEAEESTGAAAKASCELDDTSLAEPAVLQPAEVAELPVQCSNEADESAVACASGDRAEEEEEEACSLKQAPKAKEEAEEEEQVPDSLKKHCTQVADDVMSEAITQCRSETAAEPATSSTEPRTYHRKVSPPFIETNYSDETRNSDGYFTPVRKMLSSSGPPPVAEAPPVAEVRASSATELPPPRRPGSSPQTACPPEQAPLSSRSQAASPLPRGRRNSSRPPSRALDQSPGAQPSDVDSKHASPATSKRPSLVGEQRSIPLGQDPLGALVSRRPTIERTHSAEVVMRRIGSLERPPRAASETNRSLEKSLRSFEELRSSPQLPPPHGAIPGWRTPEEATRESSLRQRAERLAAEHSAKAKEREDSLLRMLDNRQQHALGVI